MVFTAFLYLPKGMNFRMKGFLSYLFLFTILNAFSSSTASSNISVKNFKHLSTENGLSQKSVRKIFQDSNGFIWMGTQEGLNRYDGRSFQHFRYNESDPRSLSGDVIRDIIEDSNRNIWIATSNGLNLFNEAEQKFERVQILSESNNPVLRLNTLFKDSTGRIQIGTDGNGVFQIDTSKNSLKVIRSALFPTLNNSDVRVIFEDTRKRYWIGTDGNGILVKEQGASTSKKLENSVNDNSSLSNNRITSITEDQKGQIWIGTRGGGLNRFNERSSNFKHFQFEENNDSSLSNNRVFKVLEDSNTNIWVATDKGINLFEPISETFTRIINLPSQKYSLTHNRVLDIFEDRSGLIWIGTLSGINLWSPVDSKFVQYQHISEANNSLSNNTVSNFSENHQNNIYVATFGGGLNIVDSKTLKISRVSTANFKKFDLHDSRLTALMVDSENSLWVGSATQGVRQFDHELNTLNTYAYAADNPSSISANGITDIFEDSDGEIWISTYGAGLNRFLKETKSFMQYQHDPNNTNSLSSNDVYQIFEDDEGYIWLATDGGGLSRLDKHNHKFVTFKSSKDNPNSLLSDTTWSITQDRNGRFWIGTQGMGLIRWEPEDRRQGKQKFQNYSIQSGLPSSTINGVIEDESGYIWISTNKGVSRLDPEKDIFTHYNLSDNIHHNEFIQGAIIKASDNRIYIGGLNGISAFYPQEISVNEHIPRVLLTQIMSENNPLLFDTPLSQLKRVTFTHKDYFLTFEFAALDYAQPNLNQYQYKLEGFDHDWIKIGNLNRATYTNLPSGKYVFKVKGSNNDGVWSDESINLEVIIEPAPWASWWAFIIYASIFCVLLIIFIRSQARRIASQDLFQKQVSEKIKTKTLELKQNNQSLKNQLNEHQHSIGIDLATGLYNQTFFTEQLLISLAWLDGTKEQSDDIKQKLFCSIVQLKNCEKSQSDHLIKVLGNKLNQMEDFYLIARWSKTEIALLSFVKSKSDMSDMISQIVNSSKKLEANTSQSQPSQIAIGYSLIPMHNNDDEGFKWENILMLTEHAMRSAAKHQDSHFIGLLSCHKKLSATLIKEIMTSENILELSDIFEFDTDI